MDWNRKQASPSQKDVPELSHQSKKTKKNFSIEKEMFALLEKIPNEHPMIGPLKGGKLCMPKESIDGRDLTWSKLIKSIAKNLLNHPTSIDDCWFIAANKEDGTHHKKISPSGDQNKFQTHRITHLLLHPEYHSLVESKEKSDLHFAHKCGRGKAKSRGGPTCINPYHLLVVPGSLNQDHKGCKYGSRATCPHTPKCIFTWPDTGLIKPCFMQDKGIPVDCLCERKCSHVIENID